MRPSRPTGMEGNEARKSKISNIFASSISAKIYSTHNLSLMHTIAVSMKAVLFYQILNLMNTIELYTID